MSGLPNIFLIHGNQKRERKRKGKKLDGLNVLQSPPTVYKGHYSGSSISTKSCEPASIDLPLSSSGNSNYLIN